MDTPDMTRRILIPVLIAAVGFAAADRTLAAEPQIAGTKVISSDATARFTPLEIHKSLVIDLPGDINDVVVADPSIVNAFVQSSRRAYITGVALGWTNVYFFDADGRQIGALDIAVTSDPQPAPLNNSAFPQQVVVIFRGGSEQKFKSVSCGPDLRYTCVGEAEKLEK
jgi:pilus assembly protein CpaC